MADKIPEGSIPDVDLGDIANSKYLGLPSKEESELLMRLLEGTYGREDLRDVGEGVYMGPNFYDSQGRYVGQQPKPSLPPEEIPLE